MKKYRASGIARAAQVSKKWLQDYVNKKYAQTYHQVNISDKPKGKLEIECDVRAASLWLAWSFVGNKGNKQWSQVSFRQKD